MPIDNIEHWVGQGLTWVQYCVVVGNYARGKAGSSLSNGSGSGMGIIEFPQNFPYERPDAETITPLGGGKPVTTFFIPNADNQNGELVVATRDLALAILGETMKIEAIGDIDTVEIDPDNPTYAKMSFIVVSPAQSMESDTFQEAGFEHQWFYNVWVRNKGPRAVQQRSEREYVYELIFRKASTIPTGVALSDASNGTTKSAGREWFDQYKWTLHSFLGDGTDPTSVDLDFTPINDADLCKVYINGTEQTLTTNFTIDVANTQIDFVSGSEPSAGQETEIWYATADSLT